MIEAHHMETARPPSDELKRAAEEVGEVPRFIVTSSGFEGYQSHLYKVGNRYVLEHDSGGHSWAKDDDIDFAQRLDDMGLLPYLVE